MATIGLASQLGLTVVKEGNETYSPPITKRYSDAKLVSITPDTSVSVFSVNVSKEEQTSGTLTTGKTYTIVEYKSDDSFTNVGATDATGSTFVAAQISLTSGTLKVGRTYKITEYNTDDNFTNVGGTNEVDNIFTATGATPTKWTAASVLVEQGTSTPTKWAAGTIVKEGYNSLSKLSFTDKDVFVINVYSTIGVQDVL